MSHVVKDPMDHRFWMVEEGRRWAVTASAAAPPGTSYPWHRFAEGTQIDARGTGKRPRRSHGLDFWENLALGERLSGTGAVPGNAWGTNG